ncbi:MULTISPECIES: glucuronate isomerase [Caproicibacterium]|uniref:Uronate isomerase n=1 Tax=Caproicibacterium argilliputei TaxID=3030016 RepID=A0AA97H1J2_9FIRM|nr:glucuronate isomerase [Caproicibacterium argilliputei]WOC31367.1 glucuronate isomerase [Caproicibacterium argilliputei]
MKPLIQDDFMLHSGTASLLYHRFAEKAPIFDYHCHLSPAEILENKTYRNLTEVWLSGDHYKWRLMRAAGVPEAYITGNADPYDKFLQFSKTVPRCAGNPMYHWTQLELKRYFGIDDLLNPENAPRIWERSGEQLQSPACSARELIRRSGVAALCTTDDPVDDLHCHKALAADKSFGVRVLPSFRPETALHPENQNFTVWVQQLSQVTGQSITTLRELEDALEKRAVFFRQAGCLSADQSLASPDFRCGTRAEAEAAFQKRMEGKSLTDAETNAYQVQLLLALGRIYHRLGLVMQLHFGVIRSCSSRMLAQCGADTGFDAVGDGISAASLAALLDALDRTGELPKTVVYSLNANDNDKLASVLGCFQENVFPQKMQLGAAWWFNDHRDGMEAQMRALANTGLLSGFIGMLTDSRSFLSYTRHEYFRRILCNLLGEWTERGELPTDYDLLGGMVEDICFHNAETYFDLPKMQE